MNDRVADFFDGLACRGHEPRLERVSGTIRFDLVKDSQIDRWFLTIRGGDVAVSREERDAECLIYADRAYFERVVAGESKPLAGMVRNDFMVEGNLRLFFMFERLLPGPPGARDPRTVAAAVVDAARRRP